MAVVSPPVDGVAPIRARNAVRPFASRAPTLEEMEAITEANPELGVVGDVPPEDIRTAAEAWGRSDVTERPSATDSDNERFAPDMPDHPSVCGIVRSCPIRPRAESEPNPAAVRAAASTVDAAGDHPDPDTEASEAVLWAALFRTVSDDGASSVAAGNSPGGAVATRVVFVPRPTRGAPAAADTDFDSLADHAADTDVRSSSVPPIIAVDTTWRADVTYLLAGPTLVLAGATLTIDPGVLVRAEPAGRLTIAVGARLVARGRANAPIVFTGIVEPTVAGAGAWRGIAILGRAGTAAAGAAPDDIDGQPRILSLGGVPDLVYGGDNDNDDSGVLEQLSIRYAGFADAAALTLAGVGRATRIGSVDIVAPGGVGLRCHGGCVCVDGVSTHETDWPSFVADEGYRGYDPQ